MDQTTVAAGSADAGDGFVTVRCGIHAIRIPVSRDQSVGLLRKKLEHAFTIAPDAVARVNGRPVPSTSVPADADVVEFVRPFGEKGIGETFTVEELALKLKTSAESVAMWIEQGLEVVRCDDRSVRITETAFDEFVRRSGGARPGNSAPRNTCDVPGDTQPSDTPWPTSASINPLAIENSAMALQEPLVVKTRSLQLGAIGMCPTVCGVMKKKRLTRPQYHVVRALLDAGPEGLSKDELDVKSGHTDARKILARLAEHDSDWAAIISMPGTSGGGYRLIVD